MKKNEVFFTYGAIIGIVSAILSLVLYISNLWAAPWAMWISPLPIAIGSILNCIAYTKANDGYVSFGNVFSSGFKASLVVGGITLVYSIICIFVFPEMKDKALELSRQKMLQNPHMTDEIMESSIAMTKKMFMPIMIIGSIFGPMIWGALFSLIGAAVVKKKGEKMIEFDNI